MGAPLTTTGEQAARSWLADTRASGSRVSAGDVFMTHGLEFGIVACTPRCGGTLGASTEVAVGSSAVPLLERVQLTHLELAPASEDAEGTLYNDFVRPFLLRKRDEMRARGGRSLVVLGQDEVVNAGGHAFGVRALDPKGRYGALLESTDVYVDYVETPALVRVHVLPYEDTLPGAYTYDIFRDFLKPFFQEHPFALFAEGDHFTYRGVRFRIMATDPGNAAGRVAKETMVFSEGESLRPTIWDLLPPELQADLQRLPRGLQMLLLNTMAHEEAVNGRLAEVDSVLRRGQGVSQAQLGACGEEVCWRAADRVGETQNQCMVCLSEFEEGDLLRKVQGCEHLFHRTCIDEWLQRSATCPICKRCVGGSGGSGAGGGDGTQMGDGGIGAALMHGARVVLPGGTHSGRVVAFDPQSQRFRVTLEGGGPERLVSPEGVVQPVANVRLHGLQAGGGLNGQFVTICGADVDVARYLVQLGSRTLSVRPENCVLPAGTIARVVDLHAGGAGARWNGHYGRVVSYDGIRARHVIAMEPRRQLLSIRPRNLRV